MKVLDLFSGIGGFSLGLERAGMKTIAFCEIEEYPRKVLKKHWPGVPIYDDVRNLTYDRLKQDGIGSIDVICGGFPCQPHSFSGLRLASKDSRDLWGEMYRIACEVRRRPIIIGENVLGLLSSEDGQYFGAILRDLANIVYSAEWFNLPAGAFGAEHYRPRIWLVAYPDETQLKGGCISKRIQQEYANACYIRWGKDKPGVVRTLDGIPSQMDRLGCLGNAVVPQIPEIIGRAIMESIK